MVNTSTLPHGIAPLYRIDLPSGVATLLGSTGVESIQSLAMSPSGVLYGFSINSTGAGLVTINQSTGVATDVNPLIGDQNTAMQAMAFAQDGSLYGVGGGNLFQISTTTGATTKLFSLNADVRGMAFIPVPEPATFLVCVLGLAGGLLPLRRRPTSRNTV